MRPAEIESFDDLKTYLSEFIQWQSGDPPWDFGGMFVLLGAILDNIRRHGNAADYDLLGGYLTPEQTNFLGLLAERAAAFVDEGD